MLFLFYPKRGRETGAVDHLAQEEYPEDVGKRDFGYAGDDQEQGGQPKNPPVQNSRNIGKLFT